MTEPKDRMIGRLIADRYEMLERIGAGGMGAVYRARQVAMDREVAVKVLHREFLRDDSSRKRFVREMQATSAISHPNTVTVYDYGTTEQGEAFLVMELLAGVTLQQALLESGAMPTTRLVHITRQIAQALAGAHDKGIVHRDIKPENIMLLDSYGAADWVKVLDFGIARIGETTGEFGTENLTATGTVLGTPSYMSPERATGRGMDHRSDIYALGVLMYVMATGRTPFESTEPLSVLFKHVSAPIPLVAEKTDQPHPAWLDTLIMRLLAKDPDDRPDSLHEVVEFLDGTKDIGSTQAQAQGTGALSEVDYESKTAILPTTTGPSSAARGDNEVRVAKTRTVIKPSSGYARKPTTPRIPKHDFTRPAKPEPEEPPKREPKADDTDHIRPVPRTKAPPAKPKPKPKLTGNIGKMLGALVIIVGTVAGTSFVVMEKMSDGWRGKSRASRPAATTPESRPPIRIGVVHSLSGTMRASEQPLVDAVKFAVEEINEAGGLLGRTVDVFTADGRSQPEYFASEAERLITEEHVAALFGCWTSASRKAVKEVVERQKSLLVYPVQYEGLETSEHILYLGSAPNQQLLPAVKWAYTELEARRFYLIGSDYVFPRAANAIMTDMIKKMGAKVVGESYIALGDTKVGKIIAQIARKKPDIILNTLNGDSNVPFYRALAQGEHTHNVGNIPTLSFSIAEQELLGMDIGHMEGHYAAWSYFQSVDRAQNKTFIEGFKAKYGSHRVVTDPMEATYSGVHLWAQAVVAVKKTNATAVRQAMMQISFPGPGGPLRIDSATGHAAKYARIGRVDSRGQFKLVYASVDPIGPKPYPVSRSPAEWRSFLEKLYTGWGGRWEAPVD